MFSFKEFRSHERTMALFLCQKVYKGEVELGHSEVPSMKAILCLADKAIITDLFQLSKPSPLKRLATKGRPGLSEG